MARLLYIFMIMKNSTTYKVFVLSFLVLFSFFHVGFAAVEYICSMGMDMEAPVCTNCHPDHEPAKNTPVIVSVNNTECCNVVVTKTKTFDNYIANTLNLSQIIVYNVTPVEVVTTPDEKPVFTSLDTTDPIQSIYDLHGISTSIHFSSFLR